MDVKKFESKDPLEGFEKCLYYCCNIFTIIASLGCALCCGIFYVEPMQAVILMAFGKIVRTENAAGLNYIMPCCISREYVSLAINTM